MALPPPSPLPTILFSKDEFRKTIIDYSKKEEEETLSKIIKMRFEVEI